MGSREGTRQKRVRVITNDPVNQNIQLTVSADVVVLLGASPASLNLGTIQKGSPVERYIALSGKEKDSVIITSVDTSLKNYLNVETSAEGFEGHPDKKLKVSLNPEIPVGRFRDRVIIKTSHPKVPNIIVNTFGDVTGNISVSPKHISFGIFERGQEIERKVSIKAQGVNTFRIKNVSSNIEEIVTDIETIKEGKEYELRVKTAKKFETDILRGEITVETDDRAEKTFSIRVFGRLRR